MLRESVLKQNSSISTFVNRKQHFEFAAVVLYDNDSADFSVPVESSKQIETWLRNLYFEPYKIFSANSDWLNFV